MSRPEWIEVGRVARPHGVRGEVRIALSSDNPERFAQGSTLHARPGRRGLIESAGGERRTLTVDTVRGQADFPIVSFREVQGREAAAAIRGYVLEVESSALPGLAEGEFYPFDLEGLAVRDSLGETVGKVSEVIDAPAHPLLGIRVDPGHEVLVPFVEAAVPDVDVEGGYLVVAEDFLGRGEGAEAGARSASERQRGSRAGSDT